MIWKERARAAVMHLDFGKVVYTASNTFDYTINKFKMQPEILLININGQVIYLIEGIYFQQSWFDII